MIQDDPLLLQNPVDTVQRFRILGVNSARIFIRWDAIAPNPTSRRRPSHFNAADPAAYSNSKWAPWDALVRAAQSAGVQLLFDVSGGTPVWAQGPGAPRDKLHPSWSPSSSEYGSFVRAVATRYSGNYTPRGAASALPRVSFWSIWNEPDYGPSLAPQGVGPNQSIENSPRLYRGLVDAAWSAFQATGHGGDTILFGEVAPRGSPQWGVFNGMKPLIFMRALYCVDRSYHPLRGNAAAVRGCPTTGSGSARFRSAHPGLFNASAFADHPYMRWYPPCCEAQPDPDFTSLGTIGNLERALDRLLGAYGSSRRMPIYDTEFGYITVPPKHPTSKFNWVSTDTAAFYLNWAEYISWRDPRLVSFEQYLLEDALPALPSNDWGEFASGLLFYSPTNRGAPKPTYNAWRLPLYLPVTSTSHGRSLEVWGCVRPSHFAIADTATPQSAEIQFAPGSSSTYTTLQTVTVTAASNCYFDVRVNFPSSGSVRLTYTYPAGDPQLPGGLPIYSRHVPITIR
jgi:hypothetical protein